MSSKARSIRRSKLKREKLLEQQGTRKRENPLTADRYYPSLGAVRPTNKTRSQ